MLRHALEFLAKLRILGGNANRAHVQVALPHHDASERHKGRCRESALLSTEDDGLDNILTSLELPIRLENHARPEIVHHKRLVRLSKPKLPRKTSALDATPLSSTSTAVVSRDENVVGLSLCHARSDDTNADLGNELDRDARSRIGALEVIDELGEILDRVDVVMGGGRDEADAWGRVPEAANLNRHLEAGKLPALAGLGALGHLDLKLDAVGEVVGRDTKPSRCNLLDGRAPRGVNEALHALATLASVGLGTKLVHGDGKGLMGLVGDGAERHGPSGEALDNLCNRLNLINGDRSDLIRTQHQLPAEGHSLDEPVANLLVLGVGLAAVLARRLLQQRHLLGLIVVKLATIAVVKVAEIGKGKDIRGGILVECLLALLDITSAGRDGVVLAEASVRLELGEGHVVVLEKVGQHLVKVDAADAGGGAGECPVHDIRVDSKGLKDLSTTVRLQRGDAHLGHRLAHAIVEGSLDALGELLVRVVEGEAALIASAEERIVAHVRAHGIGAHAKDQCVVMDLMSGPRLDGKSSEGAELLLDEVLVHATDSQQGVDGRTLGPNSLVREADDLVSVAHSLSALPVDPVELRQQIGGRGRVGGVLVRHRDVNDGSLVSLHVHVLDCVHLIQREKRAVEVDALRMVATLVEKVALGAEGKAERHDHTLADGVDGRVGDLGKELLEVLVEKPRLEGQASQRGVVTHGPEGLLAVCSHRCHDGINRLGGVAVGSEQPVGGAHHPLLVADLLRLLNHIVDREHAPGPLLKGRGCCNLVLELLVADERSIHKVNHEDLTRPEPPPLNDRVDLNNLLEAPDLRRQQHLLRLPRAVGVGDVVPRGPQPVAVEGGTDDVAVCEGDHGGTVPRLHHVRVVLVEALVGVAHRAVVLPRLRDHHEHALCEGAVGTVVEKLEDVVIGPRVRLRLVNHREHLLRHLVPELGRLDVALPRPHPVLVALEGVDLAVVAQHAHRLRSTPRGKGVCGEARVHQRQVCLEALVAEVRKVLADLLRGEHSLVDDGAGAEGAGVEVGVVDGLRPLPVPLYLALKLPPEDHQLRLQDLGIQRLLALDEDLLHLGLARQGGGPECRVVGGHIPPSDDLKVLCLTKLLKNTLDLGLLLLVLGEENQPGAVFPLGGKRDALVGHDGSEVVVGNCEHHAGSVTSVDLAAAAAAVGHPLEHLESVLHDAVALRLLEVCNHADPAVIPLQVRVVQALCGGKVAHGARDGHGAVSREQLDATGGVE
mmetsp:Transcript_32603/g.79532  ORF Transcript_32603/g.79532 Transcript_32603/m.79532 type:complete len:1230 (+) Transcript_32603:1174-4863(+)